VKVGQWIEGPDGRREVDVEVRGTRDGVPHFALVECKDWKERVDIKAIDGLDSKGRDLGADSLALYSNSGFTKKALAKARRLGIACASALVEGNQLVRIVVEKYFVAKALRVNRWSLELLFPPEEASRIPNGDPRDLEYEGRPVVNWLSTISRDLLVQHDGLRLITATWAFHQPTPFRFSEADVLLTGLRLRLTCEKRWLGQLISEDVTTGFYDHVRRSVVVPNEQAYRA
jgi:Restriction endonuclease